jgi:DNA mismatch endonuclease (patch repair protein)
MQDTPDLAAQSISEGRSRNMSAIKGRDTKPEMLVRRILHADGFRFRLHVRGLPGRPDIVLPRFRTVVLVHGCFWHYHGCKDSGIPKTRRDFWHPKLLANKERDFRNTRDLLKLGWKVETIWECQLENGEALSGILRRLRRKRAQMSR